LVVDRPTGSRLDPTASADEKKAPMRALWMVAALIGVTILIFAHTTTTGIVLGIAFLLLAVFLYWRPIVHRFGLGHR
jgi:hypothetical protein